MHNEEERTAPKTNKSSFNVFAFFLGLFIHTFLFKSSPFSSFVGHRIKKENNTGQCVSVNSCSLLLAGN